MTTEELTARLTTERARFAEFAEQVRGCLARNAELRSGKVGALTADGAVRRIRAALEEYDAAGEPEQALPVPHWLAYAGVPIEQVPAEVRESVAAHRAETDQLRDGGTHV
jgi:hypothetical protein